jgi:hypothetical protein
MQDYNPDLDRPIWGAEAIGAAINRNKRQTFYLLEQGYVDADKVGGTWCSTIRRLLFSKVKQVEVSDVR